MGSIVGFLDEEGQDTPDGKLKYPSFCDNIRRLGGTF
jgi:hypothetical protein